MFIIFTSELYRQGLKFGRAKQQGEKETFSRSVLSRMERFSNKVILHFGLWKIS